MFAPPSLRATVLSPAANLAAAATENGRYLSQYPFGPIRAGFKTSHEIVDQASSWLPQPVVIVLNEVTPLSVRRYRSCPFKSSTVGTVRDWSEPLRSVRRS